MRAITDLFSNCGAPAKIKLLVLGSPGSSYENLMDQFRSLNLEHVSPAELMQQEISRRSSLGHQVERIISQGKTPSDETILALLRRWFWARKPDAGFALTGFPATLLQAKVFDEWLDARDEALDGVFVVDPASSSTVVEHYRTLGLAIEAGVSAA